jgi:hypothetical protein
LKNIKRRMTPQPLKIRADVELTCFAYDGVERIRDAMRAAQVRELEGFGALGPMCAMHIEGTWVWGWGGGGGMLDDWSASGTPCAQHRCVQLVVLGEKGVRGRGGGGVQGRRRRGGRWMGDVGWGTGCREYSMEGRDSAGGGEWSASGARCAQHRWGVSVWAGVAFWVFHV